MKATSSQQQEDGSDDDESEVSEVGLTCWLPGWMMEKCYGGLLMRCRREILFILSIII